MLGAVCVAGLQMLTEVSDWRKHIFTETVVIITILQLFNFTLNDDKENTFTFKVPLILSCQALDWTANKKLCG